MDDNSSERLVISNAADWQEVYDLRSHCDAIMVGAETLRRDNPSLRIKDDSVRLSRVTRGLRPDIAKVTITRSGNLSPESRFFTTGDAERYVFSERGIAALEGLAEVISCDGAISPAFVVTALERRGVETLMVEGGASILEWWLRSGLVDELRVAVNPAMTLGERGVAHFSFTPPQDADCRRYGLDGMEIAYYTLRPDTTTEDEKWLRMAIAESRNCPVCQTCYRVGAVIRTVAGETFTGYTHETSPTHHAEQEAIAKALAAGADLRGGAIYSSMEPCSMRKSEPESCTQLILHHGFAHVAFAAYEPDCFVCCQGAQTLREQGIDTRAYPRLATDVLTVNSHLWG